VLEGELTHTDGYAGADLLSMRARHYNPELGRFLQPDPARAEENPYAYAGNSPVAKVDPDGRFAFLAGIAVVVVRVFVLAAPAVTAAITRYGPTIQRAFGGLQAGAQRVQAIAGALRFLNSQGLRLSPHMIQRLFVRHIRIEDVANVVRSNAPFRYWHAGEWKVGYDARPQLFVGSLRNGVITTVIRAKPSYIASLLRKSP
jgi:RHS repeat-associated protein